MYKHQKQTIMKIRELTKAELEVMQILWAKEAAFVHEIREEMPEPKPAYNTVSTVVRILERKGVVAYNNFGKSHQYYPLINKEEYTQNFMQHVMHNFFDNSVAQMVSFFSERENLSVSEMEEVAKIAREVIEKKKATR